MSHWVSKWECKIDIVRLASIHRNHFICRWLTVLTFGKYLWKTHFYYYLSDDLFIKIKQKWWIEKSCKFIKFQKQQSCKIWNILQAKQKHEKKIVHNFNLKLKLKFYFSLGHFLHLFFPFCVYLYNFMFTLTTAPVAVAFYFGN